MYHYAGNNPIKYTDPDGESLLAIAAVGFLIGASIETGKQVYNQIKTNGTLDITKLDYKDILIQGASGLASSLLCATGFGVGIQIAGNTLINIGADIWSKEWHDENWNKWDVLSAGISGAIAGFIGGGGNRDIGSQLGRMNKRILDALKHKNWSEIGKAIAYFQKNTGALAKQFNKEALKDALKDFLPSELRDKIIEEIIKWIHKPNTENE